MSLPDASRTAAVLAVAVLLAACSYVDPIIKPGWRQIVFTVENTSPRPAILIVAKDEVPMGAVVGTATPQSVPPGATMDVAFGLPPEPGWAIFVNPGPQNGPLILEPDVPPDFSGRAPLSISIDVQGNVGARSEGPTPGWMGQP